MSKAIKLEDTCPHCGKHLIVKEGQYGEFLACPRFPACKFTKPLPDGDLKIYQPPSPYCKKCNHTGFLPFIKKGKVIPNTRLYCECHQDEPEHYEPIFDFPCSYDFRSFVEEQCTGQPLPSIDLPTKEGPQPFRVNLQGEPPLLSRRGGGYGRGASPLLEEPEWNKDQWQSVKQLKAQNLYLQKKLNEHIDRSQKRIKRQTITYKGIK